MVWGIINRGSTVNKYYLYIYYIYYIYIYYARTRERKNDFFTFLLFYFLTAFGVTPPLSRTRHCK